MDTKQSAVYHTAMENRGHGILSAGDLHKKLSIASLSLYCLNMILLGHLVQSECGHKLIWRSGSVCRNIALQNRVPNKGTSSKTEKWLDLLLYCSKLIFIHILLRLETEKDDQGPRQLLRSRCLRKWWLVEERHIFHTMQLISCYDWTWENSLCCIVIMF